MSAVVSITLVCDACKRTLTTSRRTVTGARGDAERKGWRVQYLAGGRHPTKVSANPKERDECPACRPDKPKADDGLFAEEGDRD